MESPKANAASEVISKWKKTGNYTHIEQKVQLEIYEKTDIRKQQKAKPFWFFKRANAINTILSILERERRASEQTVTMKIERERANLEPFPLKM